MKQLLMLGIVMCFLVMSPQVIFADTTHSDQGAVSEAGVTFKGYEKGSDTPTNKPKDPPIPGGSDITVDSGDNEGNKGSLPRTGDTYSQLALGAGIGLVGLSIYRFKKAKKS
ncbi:LPXTG cell wall anchor domain-containing protein [Listeria seeligeri]|uniref:LPXTG cell wall anchor domain-containing protein n=1 Tax=Listeria seeligeri TaxID=1640 RepID=UPI0002F1793F|nr:LPXTG cell wall anchor domain-containing protein [Listeria seeligeri]MBC1429809.1 LPXTG cell wall anchor domain-containing protein [Listeria seeligeri]MBC1724480.1 LPXTG cell wall anchor domain-containing protein [Listeria seeligeri]MBF2437188.1 LPXTG cell wall anchor domain-containing protein [Listeria seeligeri]MBF2481859.1 LPXTG cell wall anchor domain-containing protein [Listeria seeligeri]MBF2599810.1 LPXTG cell wall anchor domain-containing protein [Listeria seeligeri]